MGFEKEYKSAASLGEASLCGQAHQVAVHQAGAGLPALDPLAGLKADDQLKAATVRRSAQGEALQLHVVEDLHEPLVQLPLQ